MFNLAINSKLRGCDLVKLRVRDISHGDRISPRALVMQQKTHMPVQFEITEQARNALTDWIEIANLSLSDFVFPSRVRMASHITVRQYARIVRHWVTEIGLDPCSYGTHKFDLYVRPGANLSKNLLKAQEDGLVNIKRIPF